MSASVALKLAGAKQLRQVPMIVDASYMPRILTHKSLIGEILPDRD
jgi:hypothetical protein